MTTMYYRLGDRGTLGYLPDPNPDGTPYGLVGYGLRLRIQTGSGHVTAAGSRWTYNSAETFDGQALHNRAVMQGGVILF